jgi:hypothetical protein
MVCLARAFGEGPFVEEEVCCPTAQTCDGRCCDGACYTPLGSTASGFGRSCCPAGGIVCNGDCCTGEELCIGGICRLCLDLQEVCASTDQCCVDDQGEVICGDAGFADDTCCRNVLTGACEDHGDCCGAMLCGSSGCCHLGGAACASNAECCGDFGYACGPDGRCCIPADSNQVCDDDDDCCGDLVCSAFQFCVPPATTTTTTTSPGTTTSPPCVQGPGVECCDTFDCVGPGQSPDCVGCQRDPQTGNSSCFVLDVDESCGPGLFCCDGACTSGPQCGDLLCCPGQDCVEGGQCCRAIDCVDLGLGDNQACVSCTFDHVCLTDINNGEVCGIDPTAVCCSGFCTEGTTCAASTTTEPPLCVNLGGACGNTLPICCEGVCSPPAAGRCCIADGQPCPADPDDCCGACQSGICGD